MRAISGLTIFSSSAALGVFPCTGPEELSPAGTLPLGTSAVLFSWLWAILRYSCFFYARGHILNRQPLAFISGDRWSSMYIVPSDLFLGVRGRYL